MFVVTRVGRACYSTPAGGVSQEFLQKILARAKEATANKQVQEPRRKAVRGKSRRDDRRAGASQVINRVKESANGDSVVKQQFQSRGSRSKIGVLEAKEDLFAMVDNSSKIAPSRRTSTNRKLNRTVPGMAKKNASKRRTGSDMGVKTSENEIPMFTIPRYSNPTAYIPHTESALSLLATHSPLSNTTQSRLVDYALETLQKSDFPLARSINTGIKTSSKDRAVNMSYSLQTPFFGKYFPASSPILHREKLYKGLAIENDKSRLSSVVEGSYETLNAHSVKDFVKLSKDKSKQEDLMRNSNVVRISLSKHQDAELDVKNLVYDVCSGFKSVKELLSKP